MFGLDLDNLLPVFTTDKTKVNVDYSEILKNMSDTIPINFENVPDNFGLTKGRWKITVSNPEYTEKQFEGNTLVNVIDDDIEHKQFIVESVKHDFANKEMVITIEVTKNIIPLLVVWAGIIAIGAISAAVSFKSIITSVEKLIPKEVFSFGIVGIILILLLPIVIPLFAKRA